MGTVMTVQTDVPVADFLQSVEPERRRAEGVELLGLMNDATGLEPRMWGPGIVGYGRYAYRYGSGHSGQASLTGFSPRRSALTIYIMPGFDGLARQLASLGRHRTSVSCLYIPSLAAIDRAVLVDIVADGLARMKRMYPDWSSD